MNRYLHTQKSKLLSTLSRTILIVAAILFWTLLVAGLLIPQMRVEEDDLWTGISFGGWGRMDLPENYGKLVALVTVFCVSCMVSAVLEAIANRHMVDCEEDSYQLKRLNRKLEPGAPKKRFSHTPWTGLIAVLSELIQWGTNLWVAFLLVIGVILPKLPFGEGVTGTFAFLGFWSRIGQPDHAGELVLLAAMETTGWAIAILLRNYAQRHRKDCMKKAG